MLVRLKARLPEDQRERAALLALAALLAAGVALRFVMMLAIRPALVGYADSYAYIGAAQGPLFSDSMRPAGYPAFLRGVHTLSAQLSFTSLVQHGLGVASALLLYGAVKGQQESPLVAR